MNFNEDLLQNKESRLKVLVVILLIVNLALLAYVGTYNPEPEEVPIYHYDMIYCYEADFENLAISEQQENPWNGIFWKIYTLDGFFFTRNATHFELIRGPYVNLNVTSIGNYHLTYSYSGKERWILYEGGLEKLPWEK